MGSAHFDLSVCRFVSDHNKIKLLRRGEVDFICEDEKIKGLFKKIATENPFFYLASPVMNFSFYLINKFCMDGSVDEKVADLFKKYIFRYHEQYFSSSYSDLSLEFSELSQNSIIKDWESCRKTIINNQNENNSVYADQFLFTKLDLKGSKFKNKWTIEGFFEFTYLVRSYLSIFCQMNCRDSDLLSKINIYLTDLLEFFDLLDSVLKDENRTEPLISVFFSLEKELFLKYQKFSKSENFPEIFQNSEDLRVLYWVKSIVPFLLKGVSEILMKDKGDDRICLSLKGIECLKDIVYSQELICFYMERLKGIASFLPKKSSVTDAIYDLQKAFLGPVPSQNLKSKLDSFKDFLIDGFTFHDAVHLFNYSDCVIFCNWVEFMKPVIQKATKVYNCFFEEGIENTSDLVKEGIRVSAFLYDILIVISASEIIFDAAFRDRAMTVKNTDPFGVYAESDTIIQKFAPFLKNFGINDPTLQLIGSSYRKKGYVPFKDDPVTIYRNDLFIYVVELLKRLENHQTIYKEMFFARLAEMAVDFMGAHFFYRCHPLFAKEKESVNWEEEAKEAKNKQDGNSLFTLRFIGFVINSLWEKKEIDFSIENATTCAEVLHPFIQDEWKETRKILESMLFPIPLKRVILSEKEEEEFIERFAARLPEQDSLASLWDSCTFTQTPSSSPEEGKNEKIEMQVPSKKTVTPFSDGRLPKGVVLDDDKSIREFVLKYAEDYVTLIDAIYSKKNHRLCKSGKLLKFLGSFCQGRVREHCVFALGSNTTTVTNHRNIYPPNVVVSTLHGIFLGQFKSQKITVEEIRSLALK